MQRLREESRALAQTMTSDLRRLVQEQNDLDKDRILVVLTNDHKRGVTGVVANRLMDEFGRPLILLIEDEEGVRGSARAPEGYDILELLRLSGMNLERFGGHRQAAGLSVIPNRVADFAKAIKEAADEIYAEKPTSIELMIDLELNPEELSEALLEEMALLEPFGMGNPPPILSISRIAPERAYYIGKENRHLGLSLDHGMLQAVGWNFGDRLPEIQEKAAVDLAFHLELNEYQGRRSLRLNLLDLRWLSVHSAAS